MIKVIEKPVPRATVVCQNCGSTLEYGNADLTKDFNATINTMVAYSDSRFEPKCFRCPVCGCDVSANWITK